MSTMGINGFGAGAWAAGPVDPGGEEHSQVAVLLLAQRRHECLTEVDDELHVDPFAQHPRRAVAEEVRRVRRHVREHRLESRMTTARQGAE